MRNGFVVFCALLILAEGCMTARVQPAAPRPSMPENSTIIVGKIDYDDHGRPLFTDVLNKRPSHADDTFTIVKFEGGRPVASYDIMIAGEQPVNLKKPISVIYEWTGKGFETGLEITGHLGGQVNASGEGAAVYLALMTAPIVIGGVTGFVIGVAESIPKTAAELRKIIVNRREIVVGNTLYEYDEKGRLKFMVLYPSAEQATELVRTEFLYNGMNRDPFRTEVKSEPEQKIRVIP